MKNYLVKDLMVPLSEYATVSEKSTLLDAMFALEKAQAEFDHRKYRHKSVLVINNDKQIIGKLSFIDVLSALGTQTDTLLDQKDLIKFDFSPKFMQHRYMQQRVTSDIRNLCSTASALNVKDVMQTPSAGEYVEDNVSLKKAMYQLVTGNHSALLVTRNKTIVGILRLTDVFAAVFHTMKACENSS